MKDKSIKKNFLYNIIYQILILFIPLFCAPYLTRTLGSNGVGTYSYVYSIVYYFMILIVLGLENYGNRTIAKKRDDKKELSKNFLEIYAFQLIIGIIMLTIYFLMIHFANNEYKTIFLIQSMFVISALLDINWFFFGIEKFKVTITRNSVLKILSIILIFIFVKSEGDLWKYTLIMSFSTLISQLLLWPFLFKEIQWYKISISGIISHIKPNLKLFIPVIAVSIYKMMDKVMLGSLTSVAEVAFYENAEKIIKVPNSLITALGVVMLPRVTNLIANNKSNDAKEYITKSIKFVCFIAIPISLGIICISETFIPLFYGNDFFKTSYVLILLSLTIPMLAWGNVIRTHFLIPKEYDKIYIKSAIYGAIINLIFNFIFIPKYGSIGACIGTIMAELSVTVYQSFSVRKELNFSTYIKSVIPFIIKSIIMFMIIYPINILDINVFLKLILEVIGGIIIYALLNIKYIMEIIDINHIKKKIKNIIKK